MKTYLVGGAVRDEILGFPVKDRDYVVVGSTPEQMIAAGFKQVGADFPVFLNPETGEEYALARTERKTGKGYHGFETKFDPSVTLEDDLFRRDLTINAMARDLDTGVLYDPFNGYADLQNMVLRHVSEHFSEDPVRVLRVARFAARDLRFKIHASTMELMKQIVNDGEIDNLTPERVYLEFEKGLMQTWPSRFIAVLNESGSLGRLFPKIDSEAFLLSLNSLDLASLRKLEFQQKVSVLCTYFNDNELAYFLEKIKAPTHVSAFCHAMQKTHKLFSDFVSPTAKNILDLFNAVGAYRDKNLIIEIVRTQRVINDGGADRDLIINNLLEAYHMTKHISFGSISPDKQAVLKGKEIGQEINKLRLEMIASFI